MERLLGTLVKSLQGDTGALTIVALAVVGTLGMIAQAPAFALGGTVIGLALCYILLRTLDRRHELEVTKLEIQKLASDRLQPLRRKVQSGRAKTAKKATS